MAKLKIKKGDKVVVITGRYKGVTGDVLKVMPEDARLVVQGVNMVKRHTAPSGANAGGIIEKEGTIHVSNVAHVDPGTDKPTRIGFKVLDDGRKVRVARRSGEQIDR